MSISATKTTAARRRIDATTGVSTTAVATHRRRLVLSRRPKAVRVSLTA
jgi:hypothetical protein